MIDIRNRRYIGCKTKLVDKIYQVVNEYGYDSTNTFADIFAGTGVVAYYFAENGYKTLVNDTLLSNVVAYRAWLGSGDINLDKIGQYINEFNSINSNDLAPNYFSSIYGGKYFSNNDAKKIGFIREYIENNAEHFTKREYAFLITSLMYSTDKIANTVGHFESFLKTPPSDKGVYLEMLDINNKIKPSEIFAMDANELAKEIQYDVVYIDPPYNARQYVNFYHVLENLVRWNKPTVFEGNSMKFKRNNLKSGYCRPNSATILFKDLIKSLKCKLIVVSYSNTYTANSDSSINTISGNDIVKILSEKGVVTKKEINYKYFNAGKTNFKDHKEILYICEVQYDE